MDLAAAKIEKWHSQNEKSRLPHFEANGFPISNRPR